MHSQRFADTAPAEAWATLLDEGTSSARYPPSTGYCARPRKPGTPPAGHASSAVKPELVATGPNQVYSWDITKLHGPAKWTYYHLYVICLIQVDGFGAAKTSERSPLRM